MGVSPDCRHAGAYSGTRSRRGRRPDQNWPVFVKDHVHAAWIFSSLCYVVLHEQLSLCMLGSVGFSFGPMNGARRMFRRRIHGVQLEGTCASIDEVVGYSCWDKAQTLCRNRALLTVQDGFPFTADEDEHLIHIRVDFLADLAARWDTHQHDLAMDACDNLLTKVLVFLCKRHDI